MHVRQVGLAVLAALAMVLATIQPAAAASREILDARGDVRAYPTIIAGPSPRPAAFPAYDITRVRVRNGSVNLVAAVWLDRIRSSARVGVGLDLRSRDGSSVLDLWAVRSAGGNVSRAQLTRQDWTSVPCTIRVTWGAQGTRRVVFTVPQRCLRKTYDRFSAMTANQPPTDVWLDSTREFRVPRG